MVQVTQPPNDRAYESSPGSLAPGAPGTLLHCLLVSSRQVPHVISTTGRYHDKSIGCEPDESWLSHTGSRGAEGQTTLIDFLAESLNVSVCVTTSDLGQRNKM